MLCYNITLYDACLKLKMPNKFTIKPLILFLLLSQFATLAHAIEHQLVTEDNEQCLICFHDSNSNNALTRTLVSVNPVFSTHEKNHYQHKDIYVITCSIYNSRSPPSIL